MKIRNHRKYEWWFYPHEESKIQIPAKKFKYKSSLIRYLNANFENALGGTVTLHHNSFNSSNSIREWFVWYNDYAHSKKTPMKIELRQLDFRGRKYISKPSKISKSDKKYFAFSDKVIPLMCNIQDDNGIILPSNAKKLVELYKKRGFKDFTPNKEDQEYIDYYLEKGIDFFHWSDRCNWLRTKTVIDYFKIKGLLN